MKQLFYTLFCSAFLIIFSNHSYAQTIDEIVANYFETIGGKDNIGNIESLKMTGTAKAQGMELPMTMYNKAPGKVRMDMVFQGTEITQMAFDGETGWSTNFMSMEAEKWEQEDSDIMKAQLEFPDPFYNYKEKGYVLTLEGEEEIEGAEYFKLKLSKGTISVGGEDVANESYFFLDKEYFVTIMQREYGLKGQMKGQATETYMSDYDEVDGMYFPFTISQKMNGTTMFDFSAESIEINSEMPDDLFALPEGTSDGN